MDPRHLTQLAVILDKGTLTGAAHSLLLTQSTLTRNMATLEMQAGEPLFQRSRFGVRSTPWGKTWPGMVVPSPSKCNRPQKPFTATNWVSTRSFGWG